jgi:hypothetical protein
MNEKLQEQLTAIVDQLQVAIQTTVDFTAEQLPILLQEILRWGLAKNIILLVISSTLLLLSIHLIKIFSRIYREGKKKNSYSDDGAITLIFSSILAVVSTLFIVGNILTIAKILLAPRLYLLEYASSLLK